jgi:hypothetical protein
MDQATLVEGQLQDGEKLLARLAQEGFPVTAACWVHEGESGQWFLYIASPVVDVEGSMKAYRRALPLVLQMPQPFVIHPLEVKIIGTADALAKDVAAARDRCPGKSPGWFRGDRLGNVSIDGAYIYPPPVLTAAS